VETRVDTPVGELSFEEYFVQRWYQDPVNSVRFAGASDAEPAPGVIDAIEAADAILIAPSNPVTSIGPILAVPGIREALCRAKGKIGAISPIISGAPVNGPAGILMVAQGLPSSIAGVAQAYKDFLDVLICDTRDARAAEVLRKTGVRVQCAQTIMRTPEDKAELARKALALVSASPASEQGAAGQTSPDQASPDQASSDQASSGQSSSGHSSADKAASDEASSDQTPAEQAPASPAFIRFRSVDDPS
jgi:LPPG:FO 2-phospho-L-lactate transferase